MTPTSETVRDKRICLNHQVLEFDDQAPNEDSAHYFHNRLIKTARREKILRTTWWEEKFYSLHLMKKVTYMEKKLEKTWILIYYKTVTD